MTPCCLTAYEIPFDSEPSVPAELVCSDKLQHRTEQRDSSRPWSCILCIPVKVRFGLRFFDILNWCLIQSKAPAYIRTTATSHIFDSNIQVQYLKTRCLYLCPKINWKYLLNFETIQCSVFHSSWGQGSNQPSYNLFVGQGLFLDLHSWLFILVKTTLVYVIMCNCHWP